MTIPSIIHREPQSCIILNLRCTNCGPVRMAIASESPAPLAMACPYCNESAPAIQIGTGSTRRMLPYFDLAPNPQVLDRVQTVGKARPLLQGQLICFFEIENVCHFAKVAEVYTSLRHISRIGVPSIAFERGGELSEPVPHVSGAETLPWWCWPDELPRPEKPKANGKKARSAAGVRPEMGGR